MIRGFRDMTVCVLWFQGYGGLYDTWFQGYDCVLWFQDMAVSMIRGFRDMTVCVLWFQGYGGLYDTWFQGYDCLCGMASGMWRSVSGMWWSL